MGYRKLSARPHHHAQDPQAADASKKPTRLAQITKAVGKPIQVWFADEARWPKEHHYAALGTARHAAIPPQDQRTAWAYLFGAICPARGTGAGLVMPHCSTEAMNHHLAEIAQAVTPGAHAVLRLDQAGWHTTTKLVVPKNITLMPLPARSPELNPVENLWQFLGENWLGNRIFQSNDAILDHCCDAWSKLIDQPWRSMSIGLRQWAHEC